MQGKPLVFAVKIPKITESFFVLIGMRRLQMQRFCAILDIEVK